MSVVLDKKESITVIDSDCMVIEDIPTFENVAQYKFSNCESSILELTDSPVKEVNLTVEDDCMIAGIYKKPDKISYFGDVCFISEEPIKYHSISPRGVRTRIPSNDCVILPEENLLQRPTKLIDCIILPEESLSQRPAKLIDSIILPEESLSQRPTKLIDCIIIDDELGNENNCQTINDECILIDDQAEEDITITANLLPSKAPTSKAFMYAKVDYLNGLKRLCQSGLDLNCRNSRRWTLLMTASFAGSLSVVRYLLSQKVDLSKKDKRSDTAYSLAKEKGNKKILAILRRYKRLNSVDNSLLEDFYCAVCKEKIFHSSKKKHQLSIIHQSKINPPPPHNSFHINAKNIGYQMLLKCGWDGRNGLGKNLQGNKFPIKTATKNNRLGLGHENHSNQSSKARFKRKKLKRLGSKPTTNGFYCLVCNENIVQCSRKKHELSIPHQSKIIPPQPHDSFHITAKNRGYQMLLNCGWDGKTGLGKDLQGSKFPVKTLTKNNRLGLGHEFPPNDTKNSSTDIKEKKKKSKKMKHKSPSARKKKKLLEKAEEKKARIYYRKLLK